jgi:parvulin-like peptidyl-prolyl isomerase
VATSAATSAPAVIIQEREEPLAAQVNGQPITLAELNAEVAFFEAGSPSTAADREALLTTLLERLIDSKLIQQAAEASGVRIDEEQVAAEIALLEAEAQAQGITLDDFLAQQGLTREQYTAQVRLGLITQAINEAVIANVPTTAPRIRLRHILVADEATARDILAQLNNGADFFALARQYSLDPSSREAGGDLGWVALGDLLQPEVEQIAFALSAQARYPEPVRSVLGYHIIETLERTENEAIDPSRLAELRQRAWERWLAAQRQAATIIRYVGANATPNP